MTPTIGILKAGSTVAEQAARFGDYEAWFEAALAGTGARCAVHDVVGSAPPPPDAADGWIITGARATVCDPAPWAERLFDWIAGRAATGAPLLGVCYGHQAIAVALGGQVECHAGGWELGTVEVELTAAGRDDPLFAGLPERFLVQTTHEDHVASLPTDGVVLAGNAHTPIQAFAVGAAVRGVQFHPEVTLPIAGDYVARRGHLLASPARLEETPLAPRLFVNFVRGFVHPTG